MNVEQGSLVPRFKGQQDNFLYWSGQIKAILKAKRVWHVGRGDDGASSSASHQDGTDKTGTATEGVLDNAFAKDIACSVVLQGLAEVSTARVMAHQDDTRRT